MNLNIQINWEFQKIKLYVLYLNNPYLIKIFCGIFTENGEILDLFENN